VRKRNPYIEPENYFEGYNQSQGKEDGDLLERLCWLCFEDNKHGKELLSELEKRYVYPQLARQGSDSFATSVTYYEGFKQAIRMLRNLSESHKTRINLEKIRSKDV